MAQGEFLFSDAGNGPGSQKPGEKGGHKPQPRGRRKSSGSTARGKRSLPPKVLSVKQVTRLIKNVLNEYLPAHLVVSGEISNCVSHGSGHLYLTLKDPDSQLAAVIWRSEVARLKFTPVDGMAVVATGRVDVYEPQGKYQFYIDKLELAGVGALELAFRELAAKLREEGLFADEHKKPIPAFPTTIGIVTSPTGAAIKDIVDTLNRRFPVARKILYPVAVQGEGAAEEIARAIADLNRRREVVGGIDVMIIARGGGSLEDLWQFNKEVLARAIYASEIPVISGVGHEIDTTIADLVADCRAATPTAAAELAAPVLADVLEGLGQMHQRLLYGIRRQMKAGADALAVSARNAIFVRPLDMVRIRQQQIDERQASLTGGLSERLRRAGRQLQTTRAILQRIEPHAALRRSTEKLSEQGHLLRLRMRDCLQDKRHRLDGLRGQLTAASPQHVLPHRRQLTAHLASRLEQGSERTAWRLAQQLTALGQRLENLNPRAVLGRGYSISRDKTTGRIITAKKPPRLGDVMLTELAEQTMVESEVTAPAHKGRSLENDRRKDDNG